MPRLALSPRPMSIENPNLSKDYEECGRVEVVLLLPTVAYEKQEEYKYTDHINHKHHLAKEDGQSWVRPLDD